MSSRSPLRAIVLFTVIAVAGACGSGASKKDTGAPVTVHLGYFPNVTHATAIAGVERGIFAKALGKDKLETSTFTAGPAAMQALFNGAIDATYVGPNPAINAWAQSAGTAIKIISGATSGGAALVVKPDIADVSQLRGKKVATPQLGNTQDVALRYFLSSKGLHTDVQGGGDVTIVPQDNAQTLDAFKSGAISGAGVPEPWVSRLVIDGGGTVLVDERTLWPGGNFVTTELVVSQKFLKAHPATVRRLLDGQVDANAWVNANPVAAQQVVNAAIGTLTGKKLTDAVIAAAWKNLTFTNDPIASSFATAARHAEKVDLLKPVNLNGIFDLTLLNDALNAAHEKKVAA